MHSDSIRRHDYQVVWPLLQEETVVKTLVRSHGLSFSVCRKINNGVSCRLMQSSLHCTCMSSITWCLTPTPCSSGSCSIYWSEADCSCWLQKSAGEAGTSRAESHQRLGLRYEAASLLSQLEQRFGLGLSDISAFNIVRYRSNISLL